MKLEHYNHILKLILDAKYQASTSEEFKELVELYTVVTNDRKNRRGVIPRKYKERDQEFALYKGEEILSMGTIDELCEQFNVKRETMYYYGYQVYADRNPNGRRLVAL